MIFLMLSEYWLSTKSCGNQFIRRVARLSEYSLQFIKDALDADDFDKIYTSIRNSETESRNLLLRFEKDYPDATKSADLNIVLDVLKTKRNK